MIVQKVLCRQVPRLMRSCGVLIQQRSVLLPLSDWLSLLLQVIKNLVLQVNEIDRKVERDKEVDRGVGEERILARENRSQRFESFRRSEFSP